MEPRVAIVGAGLAGLTCAYRLAQRDVPVDVYEARDRVGGRCWSSGGWPDGQVIEHGGELVEDWQPSILALVEELGLALEHRAHGGDGVIVADGKVDSLRSVIGLPQVLAEIGADLERIGDPYADSPSDAVRALDETTATGWLDAHVPDPTLRTTLASLIAIIDGRSTDETSALAIHALLGALASSSDELADVARRGINDLMHVRGGNDTIAERLAAGLPEGSLHLGSPAQRVSRDDGEFLVESSDGESRASRAVLTAPLPSLRKIDLAGLELSERMRDAIAEVPLGTNTKLILGFHRRPEERPDWPGNLTFMDDGITAWATSSGQEGTAGILTLFTEGKRFRASTAHGEPSDTVVRDALDLLEKPLPGISETYNGRAWLDSWPDDPWAGGSYSVFAPGQYSRFAGKLGEEEDGLHFAGEHTSVASQGYMDGAIESGERVAREVRSALGR